jgi:hypothetical protein
MGYKILEMKSGRYTVDALIAEIETEIQRIL